MNGYVSRMGRQLGVPTPLNDSLVHMVKFKAQLGRQARRQPRDEPRKLHSMRLSERYGATYRPEGIKVSHKKTGSRSNKETTSSGNSDDVSSSEEATSH